MKKLTCTLAAAFIAVTAIAFSACKKNENPDSVSVYMPDGAPALSMANLLYEDYQVRNSGKSSEENLTVNYNVVDSSSISAYVTGSEPKADLCVLPVNLASKLLGTGEIYEMLGCVTHGNLYLLSAKYNDKITTQNLSSLKGKTVGVVQLANVPGLIFKSILKDNLIDYNELGNDGNTVEDKVNLKSIDGTDVGTLQDVDYYVAPEPAASTKVNKIKTLDFVGDLQQLYGGADGYVQAVFVAKKSFVDNYGDYVRDFLRDMENNSAWLDSATAEDVVTAVTYHLTEGMTPTFNANNLTKGVISNCGIKFVYSADCKEATNEIITKFISLNANSAKNVFDSFYNTEFSAK